MPKKQPTTIEECNAELELTQKKIRQFENREKMLRQKLSKEERRTRSHPNPQAESAKRRPFALCTFALSR